MTSGRWLVLLHQIPPEPAYFRAKVMRRLQRLGALALKKSAYVLPATADTLEDFEWLSEEILKEGGDAWVLRAEPLLGHTDESLEQGFRDARADDFRTLADEARRALQLARKRTGDVERLLEGLRKRREELRRIDFFHSPEAQEPDTLITAIEEALDDSAAPTPDDLAPLRGRTWVTRQGIKVDRIASAWLIRRFIDPAARFAFVDPKSHKHRDDELRFDIVGGEYTHEGELCTFEVLVRRARRKDGALRAIAEIVHDIDLKDARFGRAEVTGFAAVIDGIIAGHGDDEARRDEGARVLDALYRHLGGRR